MPPADFDSLRGDGSFWPPAGGATAGQRESGTGACWFVALFGCGGGRILGPPA